MKKKKKNCTKLNGETKVRKKLDSTSTRKYQHWEMKMFTWSCITELTHQPPTSNQTI